MKHQIVLVGGQLLPIYLGIKEFDPDFIHLIVSNETKDRIGKLKSLMTGKSFSEYNCDPFDYSSIRSSCEMALEKINCDDEILFNLTGGTKIMVLAAQALIHERNLKGYYINTDNSYLELPTYEKKELLCELSINEFLGLSGHNLSGYKHFVDYTKDDIRESHSIEAFSRNDNRYKTITTFFRDKYSGQNNPIPLKGCETIKNQIKVTWDNSLIEASDGGVTFLTYSSKNIINLFFKAAWWELLISEQVIKWNKAKEIYIQCELPFKSDNQITKNEIDILINTGKKLIFVECKSGIVKQEDINKMRVIKETYGGIISKSILVSRFLPSKTIMEKCKELDIEVFFCYIVKKQINPLFKLSWQLNNLEKKLTA
jgi:hypothetical protein